MSHTGFSCQTCLGAHPHLQNCGAGTVTTSSPPRLHYLSEPHMPGRGCRRSLVASRQPDVRIQGLCPPSVCVPGPVPFGQSWQMPTCFVCTPASETRVLERIRNTPFCGFWVILPIWGNNPHYALWSFLIKMTFPFSLKVEISA